MEPRRQQFWMLPLILITGVTVASVVTLHWPPWGDELHYIDTVKQFGQGLSLQLLRTYPEMTAPLTFITYGFWGRIVGFETWRLRLLSPVLALAALLLLTRVLRQRTKDDLAVLIGTLSIATTPYFVGLSAFVFTDMLALLCMMVAVAGMTGDRAWMTGAGIACAILARQYLVFLVPAVALAALIGEGTRRAIRSPQVWSAGLAVLPFAALVWLWDGTLSPINELRHNYVTGRGIRFNPHALSLYLAVPGIYLAPLLAWRARAGIRRGSVAVGCALALVTLWFPIQPSEPQISEGSMTVGFAHRALTYLLPSIAVNLVWFSAAVAWMSVAGEALRLDAMLCRQRGVTAADLLPWTGIVGFLAIMPFSYLPWEKYALPLLVLIVAALIRRPTSDRYSSDERRVPRMRAATSTSSGTGSGRPIP